jgi:MULE transposase domain
MFFGFVTQQCLSVQIGEQILLGVAWCREDEVRLFEKHPEVFMFDVTMQTNNEKRPLGIAASVDQNMNVFTPLRVFMPSQQAWVMDWIFGTCIPMLLGKENLERTQIVLTDGDRQMYGAFDNNQKEHYPNAHHALCMYHLINKGIERVKCMFRRYDKPRTQDIIHTFKMSCFTWFQIGGVETLWEYNVSEKALVDWLSDLMGDEKEDKDIRHNAGVLQNFLRQCVLPHKRRYLVVERNGKRTLDYRSNSALEGKSQK